MLPIIAIDPGREKCGVAVVDEEMRALWKKVVDTAALVDEVRALLAKYRSDTIVLGDGTSSDKARKRLEMAFLEETLLLEIVDEYRTTDAAKARYWRENPPKWYKRLIPTTMQVPPEPVDDYVAVILAERYLEKRNSASVRQDGVSV